MNQFLLIGVREIKGYPYVTLMALEREREIPTHPNKAISPCDSISTLNYPAFYSTFSWVSDCSYLETAYATLDEYAFTPLIFDLPENKCFIKTTALYFGATYKDVGATYKDVVGTYNDVGATYKDVGATYKDGVATYKDVGATYKDVGATYKDVGATYKDVGAAYKDVRETYKYFTAKSLSGP
jgi:hypothetical protein